MDNWPDKKVLEAPVNAQEFEQLLSLFRDWKAKNTTNIVKLGVRLDSAYESLSRPKRREFTRLLIERGEIDDGLALALENFNGSLVRLTMEAKNA